MPKQAMLEATISFYDTRQWVDVTGIWISEDAKTRADNGDEAAIGHIFRKLRINCNQQHHFQPQHLEYRELVWKFVRRVASDEEALEREIGEHHAPFGAEDIDSCGCATPFKSLQ